MMLNARRTYSQALLIARATVYLKRSRGSFHFCENVTIEIPLLSLSVGTGGKRGELKPAEM